jgi:hypothetical protein
MSAVALMFRNNTHTFSYKNQQEQLEWMSIIDLYIPPMRNASPADGYEEVRKIV